MAKTQSFSFQFQNGYGGYIPLYPKVDNDRILGWNSGAVFGPFNFTLKANGWSANRQSFQAIGATEDDNVNCNIVLTGGIDEMKAKMQAYSLLKSVRSYKNRVEFVCDAIPETDFEVQVWWIK